MWKTDLIEEKAIAYKTSGINQLVAWNCRIAVNCGLSEELIGISRTTKLLSFKSKTIVIVLEW
jgi:hypothetical protein